MKSGNRRRIFYTRAVFPPERKLYNDFVHREKYILRKPIPGPFSGGGGSAGGNICYNTGALTYLTTELPSLAYEVW